MPAATRCLRVLKFLATQPEPMPLDRIRRACDLPRSSAYHLLQAMVEEGFVAHVEDEHRYGLGVAAFEVGSGYSRHEPLQRLARRLLANVVDQTQESAHFAVLHGRDVLYVVEERAPGRPSLVSDVGVRLPAHLTASGRAILAALPPAQVRALYPRPRGLRRAPRHRADVAERPARGPGRDPPARPRRRGRRRHPGLRERGGRRARPLRTPGGRGRPHLREPRPRATTSSTPRLQAAGSLTQRLGGRVTREPVVR